MPHALFQLGHVVATPAALSALTEAGESVTGFLARHQSGDWGDLADDDKRFNDEAVADESNPSLRGRVLSAYRTRLGVKLWVITEQDRSATSLLLPEEY